MKITRKSELIITRERSVTIKFRNASDEKFCSACNNAARFITVDEAAVIWQTTARVIFRLIEADQIHFNETGNGSLLVCIESLSKAANDFSSLPERNQNDC